MYAGWSSAYRPSGIFFDETEATSTYASLYSGYASTVKSHSGLTYVSFAIRKSSLHPSPLMQTFLRRFFVLQVTFNPGSAPATTFYSFADSIVTYEGYSSDFRHVPILRSEQLL